jgi:hypothetical protein
VTIRLYDSGEDLLVGFVGIRPEPAGGGPSYETGDALLLEIGDFLLLESGDKLLIDF